MPRAVLRALLAGCLCILAAAGQNAAADSGPSNRTLVELGLGFGLIDYVLGSTLHEESHVMAAHLVGADADISLLPSFTSSGTFYFAHFSDLRKNGCAPAYLAGQAPAGCQFSDNEYALIYIAPKMTDVVVFVGAMTAFERGWFADNKYLELANDVAATGALVDFGKDVFATDPERDLPRFYKYIHADSIRETVPLRVLHGTLTAAGAIELGRMYYHLFKDRPGDIVKGQDFGLKSPQGEMHLVIEPSFIGIGGTL
jgi:hypothetical protein